MERTRKYIFIHASAGTHAGKVVKHQLLLLEIEVDMLHEKTPDVNGWYWIEINGKWGMGYLEAERERPLVLLVPFCEGDNCFNENDDFKLRPHVFEEERGWIDPKPFRPEDNRPAAWQPERWIGPLPCPAGDSGGSIAEFTFERHMAARAAGKSLVMVHADVCDDGSVPGCCITAVSLVSGQEAYDLAVNFFKGDPCTKTANAKWSEK